jgi:hypothetical protein
MHLIFVNDISSETNKEEDYSSANTTNILTAYTAYTNNRTYDILAQVLSRDLDEFQNVFFNLLRDKNYSLISKLINDSKFPIQIKIENITFIINDILDQPYNEIYEKQIGVLLTNITKLSSMKPLLPQFKQILNLMKMKPSYAEYSKLFVLVAIQN